MPTSQCSSIGGMQLFVHSYSGKKPAIWSRKSVVHLDLLRKIFQFSLQSNSVKSRLTLEKTSVRKMSISIATDRPETFLYN